MIEYCFVLHYFECGGGQHILLIPFKNLSHFLEVDGVGRPLVAQGHKVYVLFDDMTVMPVSNTHENRYKSSNKSHTHMDIKAQHEFIEKSLTITSCNFSDS